MSSSPSFSFPVGPHTIHTPRLILRTPISSSSSSPTSDDIPSLLAYFTDPAASENPQPHLTADTLAQRVQKWDQTRAEGANAWLIVVLRNNDDSNNDSNTTEKDEDENNNNKIIGFGGYNSFPHTRLLNSAERVSDAVPDEDKVWVADIGVGINQRYQRKGYAREAICAMAEYAFSTLQCGYVHLDTQHDNTAFRAVMSDMGIPEKEGSGEDHPDAVFAFASKSLNYDFDDKMWEGIRQDLKRRGNWPL